MIKKKMPVFKFSGQPRHKILDEVLDQENRFN